MFARFVFLDGVAAASYPLAEFDAVSITEVYFDDMESPYQQAEKLLAFMPVGYVGVLHGAASDLPQWVGRVLAPEVVAGAFVPGKSFAEALGVVHQLPEGGA